MNLPEPVHFARLLADRKPICGADDPLCVTDLPEETTCELCQRRWLVLPADHRPPPPLGFKP